ncbi:potassium channel family protein [Streptomyces sp. GbtcB7]|uniref:potassium channel family protein n=1 Tax=Streptomyces sp. GbtcB7 TaxID=2824752 RepID=UPI0034D531C8
MTHRVRLPRKVVERPIRQVVKRLAMALFVLAATAFIVWVDRDGYHDNAGDGVDFLDSLYYATVTLSTTGYGDITPVSDAARLTNIFGQRFVRCATATLQLGYVARLIVMRRSPSLSFPSQGSV